MYHATVGPSSVTRYNHPKFGLCPSRLHHKLFDQFHIEGYLDYNTNTIGKPVTFVISHVKPIDLLYWSLHGDPGWYIGPTL